TSHRVATKAYPTRPCTGISWTVCGSRSWRCSTYPRTCHEGELMHASHPGSALPVSSGRLWFGIVAAPAAWALAELVGYVLVAQGCAWSHSGAAHYATPPAFTAFVGLTILCLLLA